MSQVKKGLGRGLSALIPVDDMSFLSRVARGEIESRAINAPPSPQTIQEQAPNNAKTAVSIGKTAPEAASATKKSSRAGSKRAAPPNIKGRKAAPPKTTIEALKVTTGEIAVEAGESHKSAGATSGDVSAPLSKTQHSNQLQVANTEASSNGIPPNTEIRWIRPDQVAPNPYQPRRHFDAEELENLAASIREHGILQPILVRPVAVSASPAPNQSAAAALPFQLVAGERRWRAAQAAGVATIPAIVRVVNDQQALELAVIENVQRHDISPLDAALAYRRLSDEFSLSQEKIAQRVGKSRSAIANTLRLLDLPEEIQHSLNHGALSEGHGRAILLAGSQGARRAVFRAIIRDKLSVRDAEELARRTGAVEAHTSADTPIGSTTRGTDRVEEARTSRTPNFDGDDWKIIVEELQRALGSKVSLFNRKRGGVITIKCTSHEQMERVVKRLRTTD